MNRGEVLFDRPSGLEVGNALGKVEQHGRIYRRRTTFDAVEFGEDSPGFEPVELVGLGAVPRRRKWSINADSAPVDNPVQLIAETLSRFVPNDRHFVL